MQLKAEIDQTRQCDRRRKAVAKRKSMKLDSETKNAIDQATNNNGVDTAKQTV